MTKIKFIVKPKKQCAFCLKTITYSRTLGNKEYCLRCATTFEDDTMYLEGGRNDTEAFVEWFDDNVETLAGEDEEVDLNIMKEWCKENNHEWRDDGVYNMNVFMFIKKDGTTCFGCRTRGNPRCMCETFDSR